MLSGTPKTGTDVWEILTAIGTTAAAMVALIVAFIPSMRRRWNRPVVKITVEHKAPWCRYADPDVMVGAYLGTSKGYWIRLRIKNKGKSVLKKCQGRLGTITDVATGKPEYDDFDSVVLHWVGHKKWYPDMNKDQFEYLDVFHVTQRVPDIFQIGGGEQRTTRHTPRQTEETCQARHCNLR